MKLAAEGKSFRLLTPEIGEAVYIGDDTQHFREWWNMMK